jgi:hypothetical protein
MGVLPAWEFYRHSPVTAGIDIYNAEAEAYGATVEEPDGFLVPSIREPRMDSIDAIMSLTGKDLAARGRFPLLQEAACLIQARLPGVPVRVPLAGPFSQAGALSGFGALLCAVAAEPARVRDALMVLAENQARLIAALAEGGLRVTVFESAAAPPFLSPRLFESVEAPALATLADAHRSAWGTGPSLIMGGDTARVLPALLRLQPSFLICPAETDQDAFLGTTGVGPGIRVNMDTRLLVVEERTALAEAHRVRSLLERHGRRAPGMPLSAGTGVLPYDFPRERFHSLAAAFEADG